MLEGHTDLKIFHIGNVPDETNQSKIRSDKSVVNQKQYSYGVKYWGYVELLGTERKRGSKKSDETIRKIHTKRTRDLEKN